MTKLTKALENLGFTTEEKQQALLENLYFAGYFSQEKLEKDLSSLSKSVPFAGGKNAATKYAIWGHACQTVMNAESTEDGVSQLDSKKVLQELFRDDDTRIDQQDVEDLVLFWCQNAFDRKFGQERNELNKQGWMELHKDRYLENARTLGLNDAVEPTQKKYDEIWVQGASRPRVITRLNYTKNLIDAGKIEMTEVKLLAGDRELWAEIDGIGETAEAKVQDGVEYMIALAKKNNIQLGEPQFVKCEKDDQAKKRFAGRTYLNYANGEKRKVTEAMACEDLCQKILPRTKVDESSEVEQHQYRPTTFTTSKHAAEALAKKSLKLGEGEKIEKSVLVIAEQPYSDRMNTAVQTILDGMKTEKKIITDGGKKKEVPKYENLDGYKFTSHVAGNAATVGVEGFHSELGALVSEKYHALAQQQKSEGVERKRPRDALLFQPRGAFLKNLDQQVQTR